VPNSNHEDRYVAFESAARCFVSPALGCASVCSYCYLPLLGYSVGQEPQITRSAEGILEAIMSNSNFTKGRNGTCISLGCYTECLSKSVIDMTELLVNNFLALGNPVTIATKQDPISLLDRCGQNIGWGGQLGVFLSCPTIRYWPRHEKNTASPAQRLSRIGLLTNAKANVALYVKPFLGEDTAVDLERFGEILSETQIPAVVGAKFKKKRQGQPAPIAPGSLKIVDDQGYSLFRKGLAAYGVVYKRSIEVISLWYQK